MIVYHGTSKKSWEKPLHGERTLYVTNKLWVAESYAQESVWEHEHKGLIDEPMVIAIDLSRVNGIKIEPDWGAFGVNKNTPWHETAKSYGTFSIRGNIERLKKMFITKNLTSKKVVI